MRIGCLLFVLAFQFFTGNAQNLRPEITLLSAEVDTNAQQIVVSYDLMDFEKDTSDIKIRICSDSECLDFSRIEGQIGYPVEVGSDCSIILTYKDINEKFEAYSVFLTADDRHMEDVAVLVNASKARNLKKNIASIYGIRNLKSNPDHHLKVRNHILKEFRDQGLIAYTQNFNATKISNNKTFDKNSTPYGVNLIGEIRGIDDSDELIIIGAHYDTVDVSKGADDNGSGVSSLLETMKILSNYSFSKTILFIAFDQEEYGMLGSSYFVEQYQKNQKKVLAYINLDMIGFYNAEKNSQPFPQEMKSIFPIAYEKVSKNEFRGDFILSTSNESSVNLMKSFEANAKQFSKQLKVVSIAVPDDGKFAPDEFRSSDHVAFWDANISAINIGDTGDLRNRNYHGPKDTISTLNFDFMNSITKALVATISDLAKIKHAGVAYGNLNNSAKEKESGV